MTSLHWLESNGGPLALIPRAVLPHWSGVEAPVDATPRAATWRLDPTGPVTDYDRACSIEEYAGVLPVGQGEALILGQEPLPTAWRPNRHGGLFIRWICAESEADVLRLLDQPHDALNWVDEAVFRVTHTPLVLIDAADVGFDLSGPSFELDLSPAAYTVRRGQATDSAGTELLLHRLVRQ
jgi:hypothetical protein